MPNKLQKSHFRLHKCQNEVTKVPLHIALPSLPPLSPPLKKKKTIASIACLWFYCLSSPLFLLLTLFVAIILRTVLFSLPWLVVLFSCILRIARSLLRLNISFKSCTMLFSSLFDFLVKYLHYSLFQLKFLSYI